MKRFAVAWLAVALLGAAACGRRSDAGIVEVEFWGLGREGEIVR